MLVPSRSLLNMRYVLMNVLKTLASIVSICSFHVIVPSKITLRNFTLFLYRMLSPFSVRRNCGGLIR
jgi:hypothetical protein